MKANDRQEGGNHYRKFNIQHWDYAWDHQYDQFQYCITKYVDRHKFKNGLEDLRKARHHLDKYIELLEAEPNAFEPIDVSTLGGAGPEYVNQDR